MRAGLKKQQTTLADCGFLPEGMLMHRARQHGTTIHELIRNPGLYDQAACLQAADAANFARPADLPKLIGMLGSSDEGMRYWGVIGCIQLGQPAATPEVLSLMEHLLQTDVKDERTLDVRVTAALYLCQVEHEKDKALRSMAEVIGTAPDKSPAKGRAWANLLLLGSGAKDIVGLLGPMKLNQQCQAMLARFQSQMD
jgi:hypothetical protein